MAEMYGPIEQKMKLWRKGLITINETGYIEFHKAFAEKKLEEIKAAGWIVRVQWMDYDGWLDGMRVLYAIVERQLPRENLELKKIKWNDGNSEGSWFECGCGAWPFIFK